MSVLTEQQLAAYREQIRRACADADNFLFESLEPHDYQKQADTVLALIQAEVLPAYEQDLRSQIANDVNRADRPTFADSERPDLVVRTTRAIDIQLIEQASQAPYWVPEGGAR